MNLAKLALDNSRITISAILLIVVVGIGTYLTFPSAEDPTITIRNVSITATYPGMTADRVEELIAKPLEAAMREIAEIDEIKSTSTLGTVKLIVAIHDDRDVVHVVCTVANGDDHALVGMNDLRRSLQTLFEHSGTLLKHNEGGIRYEIEFREQDRPDLA